MSDWPEPNDQHVNDALRRKMQLARRVAGLGRSARTEAKVRIRQPLSRALVLTPSAEADDLFSVQDLIQEELNVKQVAHADSLGDFVSYEVKPNFKTLGPRFGGRVKEVAQALAKEDADSLAARADSEGKVTITMGNEPIELDRDDLDIRVHQKGDFFVAREGHYAVALDLSMTPELVAEGVAREVVRAVQDLRKSSGLAVEDRIELWLGTNDADVDAAMAKHREFIASEVLATTVNPSDPGDGMESTTLEIEGGRVTIGLKKA